MAEEQMTLTPEQFAQLDAYHAEWLAHSISTKRSDRATAEKIWFKIYDDLNLAKPQVVWFEGPVSASVARAMIVDKSGREHMEHLRFYYCQEAIDYFLAQKLLELYNACQDAQGAKGGLDTTYRRQLMGQIVAACDIRNQLPEEHTNKELLPKDLTPAFDELKAFVANQEHVVVNQIYSEIGRTLAKRPDYKEQPEAENKAFCVNQSILEYMLPRAASPDGARRLRYAIASGSMMVDQDSIPYFMIEVIDGMARGVVPKPTEYGTLLGAMPSSEQEWVENNMPIVKQLQEKMQDLHDKLVDKLRNKDGESFLRQLDHAMISAVESSRNSQALSWTFWGQHEAHWIAYYDFPDRYVKKIHSPELRERLDWWIELTQATGWWHPTDTVIFACERPHTCSLDDNIAPHGEGGPAFKSRDGWTLWYHHGVEVNEQIIMAPETQTMDQIRNESSEEVKRVRIEMYGWEKYLVAINAKLIDKRHNEIENTIELLAKTPDNMVIFIAPDPSTARIYSLEVPPETEKCVDAQKYLWSGSTLAEKHTLRVIGRT